MDRMSFLSVGSYYNCHNNSASFIKVEIKIFVFLRIVLFSCTQLIRRKFRRRQGKVFAEFLNLIVTTLGWAGMSFIELAVGRVHSEKLKVPTRNRKQVTNWSTGFDLKELELKIKPRDIK